MAVAKCFGTETCGGEGPKIFITHVKSGATLTFPAFLTNINDQYTSEWKEETVYGRMDPIATYQRTGRVIELAWKVISTSKEEARSNMFMISKLINFHYPSFLATGNANLIQSAPLMRIRFEPFVRKINGGGLLGYTKGVQINPNVDAGFIFDTRSQNYKMMPKELEINLNFTVLHEHDLGFDSLGRLKRSAFPYGAVRARCARYEEDLPENDMANAYTTEGLAEIMAVQADIAQGGDGSLVAQKENAVPQAASKPQAQIDAEEKIARKNPASFERQFERSEDIFSDADLDAELKKIEMQKQIKEKSASSRFAGPSLDGEPKKLTRREKNKLAQQERKEKQKQKRKADQKKKKARQEKRKQKAELEKMLREAKKMEKKAKQNYGKNEDPGSDAGGGYR